MVPNPGASGVSVRKAVVKLEHSAERGKEHAKRPSHPSNQLAGAYHIRAIYLGIDRIVRGGGRGAPAMPSELFGLR